MRSLLIILAAALLAGCATTPGFESSMNSQVGILTYDDAIRTWGPPASVAEGDRVIVAAWSRPRATSSVYTGGIAVTSHRSSDLTVTFDKETKRMIDWRQE